MHLTLNRNNSLLLFSVLALGLVGAERWIAISLARTQNPEIVVIAITADVAVGVPLLYFILLARKRYFSLVGVAVSYLSALVAVRLIMPAAFQSHFGFVDVVSAELAVFGVVAIKARDVASRVRLFQSDELYFADALRKGIQQGAGYSLLATVLSMEMSLIFFAFFGWFTRFHTDRPDHRAFSYHRRGTWPLVIFTIIFIGILETFALHIIIQIWSVQLAWIVTGLSVYTLWWLVGYYQSTRLQPVVVSPRYLHIRTGFRYRAVIPLSDIVLVRKWKSADNNLEGFVNVAVFGEPGLCLLLKEPATIVGFFGKAQECEALGITLDDEQAFRLELAAPVKELADFSEVV